MPVTVRVVDLQSTMAVVVLVIMRVGDAWQGRERKEELHRFSSARMLRWGGEILVWKNIPDVAPEILLFPFPSSAYNLSESISSTVLRGIPCGSFRAWLIHVSRSTPHYSPLVLRDGLVLLPRTGRRHGSTDHVMRGREHRQF